MKQENTLFKSAKASDKLTRARRSRKKVSAVKKALHSAISNTDFLLNKPGAGLYKEPCAGLNPDCILIF
jgi:hypothetical protein